jgi:hypothetical protein
MARWFLTFGIVLAIGLPAAAAEWVPLGNGGPPLEVVVLSSDGTRTVLEYRIAGFEREAVTIDGATWYRVGLAGESRTQALGLPEVPDVQRSVLIPDNAQMAARVLEEEFVDVADMPVVPSKGPIPRTIDPASVPYEFGAFYGGDAWFPAETAVIGEPYILRDFRGAVLTANPFRYNPSTQTLRVSTRLVIEVVVEGPGGANVIDRAGPPATIDAEFARIYSSHFVNYGEYSRYAPVSEIGKMLIITYDAFHSAVQPLADWKNQCGVPCEIVDKSVAGSTSTQIKSFVQTYYDTNGLTFILLVGDAAQMPTFNYAGGASDPSYALLAGGDNYPDAFVGRLSAENVTQVETQVQRIVGYESAPMAGGAWYHRGTGIASNQGPGDDGEYDNQHMDNIRLDLLAYTYTDVDRIYDPTGTAAMVTNALNEGRGIVNYCGHGWEGGWSSTGFSSNNVNSLTNDWMLPFIVSVACVNGEFVGGTCFAEAWLRATHAGAPTGAVGTYMSSVNQYWNEPMCAQDEAVDLLVGEEMRTYGGLCFNGSCQMMDEYGGSGVDMFRTWIIFGDPSLLVRTDTPAAMTVNHDEAIPPDAVTFTVTVPGVEGALCGLSYQGTYHGSAFTDAAGVASIVVQGTLPAGENVTLTVTAPNKIPYVAPILVGELAIPAMVIDPDQIQEEVPLGGEATVILTIGNVGEAESILHFDISVVHAPGPVWVSVSPDNGSVPYGEEAAIEVTLSAAGLLPGVYSRALRIESNAGDPVIVPVLMGVGGEPIDVRDEATPSALVVEPNLPNPFQRGTSFAFSTPTDGHVRLEVYDLTGRRVATPVDRELPAGPHAVHWNGRGEGGSLLAPGVYYYRVSTTGGTSEMRRLLIVR